MQHPLEVQPLDPEFAESFGKNVRAGMEMAAGQTINFVAIARNCGKHLENTFTCMDSLRPHFGDVRLYVFENDSTDGTAEALDRYQIAHPSNVVIEHDTLGRPDMRGWEEQRTTYLAEYRNRCRDFVEATWAEALWTVVIDMDPHGGWLPDGVFNSIYWLSPAGVGWRWNHDRDKWSGPGAMASYSIYRQTADDGEAWWAHYDAFAARPTCWWRHRLKEIGMGWFQQMMLPIGAPPMRMNSAFGGLCVYRTGAYLGGRYSGKNADCEHVNFHRELADNGWDLYLNPGSVYVAYLG